MTLVRWRCEGEDLRTMPRVPAWITGWTVVPFSHVGNSEEGAWRPWHPPSPLCVLSSSWRTSKATSQAGLKLQPIVFLTSLTLVAFTWTPFQPSALSTMPVSLCFPELPHTRNPTLGRPPFCLPPGSCQHSLCWLAPHVCFCLGKSSQPAACLFSVCASSILCYCFSQTARTHDHDPCLLLQPLLLAWSCVLAFLFQAEQKIRRF